MGMEMNEIGHGKWRKMRNAQQAKNAKRLREQ